MEGHLLSPFLGDAHRPARDFAPHLALSVSGGHTELVLVSGLGRYRVLGATRDDAAGEAFDKVAKMLGLGYPGGPVIDGSRPRGWQRAVTFRVRCSIDASLEFSFSGLKTAVAVHMRQHGQPTRAGAGGRVRVVSGGGDRGAGRARPGSRGAVRGTAADGGRRCVGQSRAARRDGGGCRERRVRPSRRRCATAGTMRR
jgi:hypothetical protein